VSFTPTYPGVYIQELPSSVKTITGVATSITAFIGRALRGPIDLDPQSPILINSWGDYERNFGGLWKLSEMSYAVYQYFLNGGNTALIIRVQLNGKYSEYSSSLNSNFTLKASNPGTWGDNLQITVDTKVNPDLKAKDPTIFNLSIIDINPAPGGGQIEKYFNLSADPAKNQYVATVLQYQSQLVQVSGTFPISQPPEGDFQINNSGNDGDPINDMAIQGDQTSKTGYWALEKADIFNILCIPPLEESIDPSIPTLGLAKSYCEGPKPGKTSGGKHRAILLVDPRKEWEISSSLDSGILSTSTGINSTDLEGLRSTNAALFFPRIYMVDPLDQTKIRKFVPSGMIAGVISSTDSSRGVWKSPAGIDASLAGVSDLTFNLTDSDNGRLNPLGINCLRIMPVVGPVIWGSRTLRGADTLADPWKYLAVRRTALFIEESLYRGIQWVVFEPNDEPLWSQIRLNVSSFMQNLFLKGAFQGKTPKDAYLVKCDSETTTQRDIDSGIVNIIVGFAPLKPAEFVILKIEQLAGQQGA